MGNIVLWSEFACNTSATRLTTRVFVDVFHRTLTMHIRCSEFSLCEYFDKQFYSEDGEECLYFPRFVCIGAKAKETLLPEGFTEC